MSCLSWKWPYLPWAPGQVAVYGAGHGNSSIGLAGWTVGSVLNGSVCHKVLFCNHLCWLTLYRRHFALKLPMFQLCLYALYPFFFTSFLSFIICIFCGSSYASLIQYSILTIFSWQWFLGFMDGLEGRRPTETKDLSWPISGGSGGSSGSSGGGNDWLPFQAVLPLQVGQLHSIALSLNWAGLDLSCRWAWVRDKWMSQWSKLIFYLLSFT